MNPLVSLQVDRLAHSYYAVCYPGTPHTRLYKEALANLDQSEEIFYYLCPVCGNIEKFVPDKCSICGAPGSKFIKY